MNEVDSEFCISRKQIKENVKRWLKTNRIKKAKIINGKLIAQEDISAGDFIEIPLGYLYYKKKQKEPNRGNLGENKYLFRSSKYEIWIEHSKESWYIILGNNATGQIILLFNYRIFPKRCLEISTLNNCVLFYLGKIL